MKLLKNRKAKKQKEEIRPAPIKIKKHYTLRLAMLVIGGLSTCIGIGLFVLYFNSTNMGFGLPSIPFIAGGIFLFKYYWSRDEENVTLQFGEVQKEQVNGLCLYPDKIVFENVDNPGGYPQKCLNDGKSYFVMIKDEEEDKLIPFILPDQQYYDPEVFAQRVLELPAHQKVFTRKPKLFEKIKTALLVVTIFLVWMLILTTTA